MYIRCVPHGVKRANLRLCNNTQSCNRRQLNADEKPAGRLCPAPTSLKRNACPCKPFRRARLLGLGRLVFPSPDGSTIRVKPR